MSLRADAEGQHLLGRDMAGRWKAEFAVDCYATFREVAKELWMWMCGFGLSRTTRKNAETRAKQAGVSTQIQDAMNRWRTGKV